ncbi:MAG: AraC family transcriptional regulator [Ginsengibacter sp.]
MITKFYIPHPALHEFIACLFVCTNHLEQGEKHVFSPFPPNPQQSIIFYIDDPCEIQDFSSGKIDIAPPCMVVGPHLKRINSRMGMHHRMVYVGFKPGGLFRLLGIPMKELFDGAFDAAELIGNNIRHINQQLKEAKGFEEMKHIVESFFLSRLSQLRAKQPFDAAIQQLLSCHGNITIDKVADLSGLGVRQFERKCYEKIGMSPKIYARLIRFSKAYRMKESCPNINWTKITYECGYFDQMHFIRDFKQFAGVLPTAMDEELSQTPFKLQADLVI